MSGGTLFTGDIIHSDNVMLSEAPAIDNRVPGEPGDEAIYHMCTISRSRDLHESRYLHTYTNSQHFLYA